MLPLLQFAAEEKEVEGIAQLGIDPIQIALQAGTFLILYLVLRRYALAKITEVLRNRRETIEESLQNAEQIEQQKSQTAEAIQQALSEARKEAEGIIAKSNSEAGAIIEAAESKASKRAEEIITNGEAKLAQSVEKARRALKDDMLQLVTAATETVLEEKVDAQKDQQLIQKALKQGQST